MSEIFITLLKYIVTCDKSSVEEGVLPLMNGLPTKLKLWTLLLNASNMVEGIVPLIFVATSDILWSLVNAAIAGGIVPLIFSR